MQIIQKQLSRVFFLIVLVTLLPISMEAQVFKNPSVKAGNAEGVTLLSVERTDDNTIVRLRFRSTSNLSFFISSKTYIRDNEGGKPLYIEKADGVYPRITSRSNLGIDRIANLYLDHSYIDSDPDMTDLLLYFPALPKDVQSIDFRSGKNGNFWHFFEINVSTGIGKDRSVKSGQKGKNGNCYFIENPGYTAKSGGFHITTIELCDTATILHFKVDVHPGGWIYIPSKSCIRDSNGGDNLFVQSAEGTALDERITGQMVPEGVIYYKLFFPPISKSVKKIDFREINDGGSWFVYELDVDVN